MTPVSNVTLPGTELVAATLPAESKSPLDHGTAHLVNCLAHLILYRACKMPPWQPEPTEPQ